MYCLLRRNIINSLSSNRNQLIRWTRYATVSTIKPKTNNKQEKISKLLKHFKKTKRRNDIADPTHPSSITNLEINDFIKEYSQCNKLQIRSNEIRNSLELIKNFLPHQRKQDLILDNIVIREVTSQGEGIAIVPKSFYAQNFVIDHDEEIFGRFTVFLIPKTIIGDKVKIKVKMHHEYYAEGELIEVLNSNLKDSRRNNGLIVCDHFNECNGCQLQMLSYEDQLEYKQSIIKRAYRYFYPEIYKQLGNEFGMVNGSPLQYSYRTKLTPHFSVSKGINVKFGFENVNHRGKFDMKYCPIATPEINEKIAEIRNEYLGKSRPYSQVMLRQSTRINQETGDFIQVALEGQYKVTTEKINEFLFQFDSNCFFQNNNSILPNVLDYIKYHINLSGKPIDNVIDTYCGVGFFGIALSNSFQKSTKIFGIEISNTSIKYANHNVKINYLEKDKIKFIQGDASSMFKNEEFLQSGIVGKNSVVIVDPSRKGSNESFLKQLLEFEPEIIVYVSCNVFTQARDLAMFENLQKDSDAKYRVRDIMGFDFFPQTKHVESIAIIEKV